MKDIVRKELIGLNVKVCGALNNDNIGLEGSIIDETKNTITIKTKKGDKKLIKKNITLQVKKEKIIIKGNVLVGRPEDRIKKIVK